MNAGPVNGYAVREVRTVLKTRQFSPHAHQVSELVDWLHGERFTGRIIVDMSQGGVCSIQTEERSRAGYLTGNNNSA